MNIWDILILAGIGVAVVAAFRILRAKGQRGGCGCGCAGCTKTCDARQGSQGQEALNGKDCRGG